VVRKRISSWELLRPGNSQICWHLLQVNCDKIIIAENLLRDRRSFLNNPIFIQEPRSLFEWRIHFTGTVQKRSLQFFTGHEVILWMWRCLCQMSSVLEGLIQFGLIKSILNYTFLELIQIIRDTFLTYFRPPPHIPSVTFFFLFLISDFKPNMLV
jgi:hypothetical protein